MHKKNPRNVVSKTKGVLARPYQEMRNKRRRGRLGKSTKKSITAHCSSLAEDQEEPRAAIAPATESKTNKKSRRLGTIKKAKEVEKAKPAAKKAIDQEAKNRHVLFCPGRRSRATTGESGRARIAESKSNRAGNGEDEQEGLQGGGRRTATEKPTGQETKKPHVLAKSRARTAESDGEEDRVGERGMREDSLPQFGRCVAGMASARLGLGVGRYSSAGLALGVGTVVDER